MSKVGKKLIEELEAGGYTEFGDSKLEMLDKIRKLYSAFRKCNDCGTVNLNSCFGSSDIQFLEGFAELVYCQNDALFTAIWEASSQRDEIVMTAPQTLPDIYNYTYISDDYIIVLSLSWDSGLAIIYNRIDKQYRILTLGEDDGFYFPEAARCSHQMMSLLMRDALTTFSNISCL